MGNIPIFSCFAIHFWNQKAKHVNPILTCKNYWFSSYKYLTDIIATAVNQVQIIQDMAEFIYKSGTNGTALAFRKLLMWI